MKKLFAKIKAWFKKPANDPELTDGQIGIALIKQAIKALWDTAIECQSAYADKKIVVAEWIQIGGKAYQVARIVTKFGELKAQIIDIDTAEAQEILEYCGELGIVGPDASVIIVHATSIVEKGIDIYKTDVLPVVAIAKKYLKKKDYTPK